MFDLSTPVENLYLVGPARAKLLKHLGIKTLSDLLFYFPRSHQDLSNFTPINEIRAGEFVNIKAKIIEVKSFRTKVRRLTLTNALLEDETGSITAVWFNQPFLSKILKPHEQFVFSGKAVISKNKLQLQNPVYEQEKTEQVHTARLVPLYPLTANITQKQLRVIIKTYLDKVMIPEYLPLEILRAEKLLDENSAVKNFHFPKDYPTLKRAQSRLAFDEIFQTQVRVMIYKKSRLGLNSYKAEIPSELEMKIAQLPFSLTRNQKEALNSILEDLSKEHPANRLLEGDVGSGKTIVAALAMWVIAKNNYQSALLSPTEILAQQHYAGLLKLFINEGFNPALLTSNNCRINGNPVSRETLLSHLANGQVKIVLGTHAILEKKIKFRNLALAVIDEQHRFGVEQRSLLKNLNKSHLLTMSATPIPRTLALTLYGDLDISVLKELPKGRLPIKTEIIAEPDRTTAYNFIKNQIKEGRQAFVICPLVEESDKLEVKSATAEYERLKGIFPEFRIGLLHGKMKPQDKEEVMRKFKDNELQILVSTSVVEVGVDVPNATVMMIEGAEQFGLAQLHQFRGRVGRSSHQSYCFLCPHNPQGKNNPRLTAMVESNNGFELAEKDLMIRGSGDLYGTQQSGYGFRIASLADLEAVERSKRYAEKIVDQDKNLAGYPLLKKIIEEKPLLHLE
jgi:ATP-dependent DNA helicase RecG